MKKLRRPRGTGLVLASTSGMGTGNGSRFDADKFMRLVTMAEQGRCEMHFSDSEGRAHVLSLPLRAAVQLGGLICDVSETAPYLVGGIRRPGSRKRS